MAYNVSPVNPAPVVQGPGAQELIKALAPPNVGASFNEGNPGSLPPLVQARGMDYGPLSASVKDIGQEMINNIGINARYQSLIDHGVDPETAKAISRDPQTYGQAVISSAPTVTSNPPQYVQAFNPQTGEAIPGQYDLRPVPPSISYRAGMFSNLYGEPGQTGQSGGLQPLTAETMPGAPHAAPSNTGPASATPTAPTVQTPAPAAPTQSAAPSTTQGTPSTTPTSAVVDTDPHNSPITPNFSPRAQSFFGVMGVGIPPQLNKILPKDEQSIEAAIAAGGNTPDTVKRVQELIAQSQKNLEAVSLASATLSSIAEPGDPQSAISILDSDNGPISEFGGFDTQFNQNNPASKPYHFLKAIDGLKSQSVKETLQAFQNGNGANGIQIRSYDIALAQSLKGTLDPVASKSRLYTTIWNYVYGLATLSGVDPLKDPRSAFRVNFDPKDAQSLIDGKVTTEAFNKKYGRDGAAEQVLAYHNFGWNPPKTNPVAPTPVAPVPAPAASQAPGVPGVSPTPTPRFGNPDDKPVAAPAQQAPLQVTPQPATPPVSSVPQAQPVTINPPVVPGVPTPPPVVVGPQPNQKLPVIFGQQSYDQLSSGQMYIDGNDGQTKKKP